MENRKIQLANIFDFIVEYCLYLVILLLPFSKAAIEVLFFPAFFSFVLKKILTGDFKKYLSKPFLFLGLFIIFISLSLLNSHELLAKSINALFFKWIENFVFFVMAFETLGKPNRLKMVGFIFTVSGFMVVIDSCFQRAFGFDPIRHNKLIFKKNYTAVRGPFQHYNNLAAYLLVYLSLIASLVLSKIKKIYKAFLLFLFILSLFCLLFTFSRGAWLSFLFTIFIILIFTGRYKELGVITVLFTVILIAVPFFRDRMLFLFQSGGDSTRFAMWGYAWKMITENPFLGKGLGNFMEYMNRYSAGDFIEYAHNCFLQIWAETGLFSLVSFLLFISTVFFRSINRVRQSKDAILFGFTCGCIGFLMHSFFDTHLYSLQLSTLFWILMGVILGASTNRERLTQITLK